MIDRHIVAMGGGGFTMDDPVLDRYVVELAGTRRPRVCFLPTASGDDAGYIARFEQAFPAGSFSTTVLRLFDREVADLSSFLGEQDVVYVGGGNTVNMLAVWRQHGVDDALHAAWSSGIVLAGMSAGANCWFEACTTDSYLLGRADPLLDGLGFLPGSFTPHYRGETDRRPSLMSLVASGVLPGGWACDDFAAVHYEGGRVRAAVASRPGASAWRIEREDGEVAERATEMRQL